VITSGAYALPDGTKVEIEKPGAEDKEGAGKAGDEEKKGADDTGGAKGDQKKKASPDGAAKSTGSGKE
jgi:hypothetical protein